MHRFYSFYFPSHHGLSAISSANRLLDPAVNIIHVYAVKRVEKLMPVGFPFPDFQPVLPAIAIDRAERIIGKTFASIIETAIMTIQEVAGRLVELCRKGEFGTAQDELFSADAVSIELYASPAFEKETRGLSAIKEKNKKFDGMVEAFFGQTVSEPLVTKHSIAFILTMDIQMKGQERGNMKELCVYEVKGNKIISEQFFL